MKDLNSNARQGGSVGFILAETWRFFSSAPYSVKIIWRFERKLLLVLAGSTVLDGVSPALSVLVGRYFLDAIVEVYKHGGQAACIQRAVVWLGLQIAIGAGCAGTAKIVSYFKTLLAARLSLCLQADIIDGMAGLEMKDYDDPEIYNMINRARSEAQNNKPLVIVGGVCDILSSGITFLSFSVVLFSFSPLLPLAMFGICIPYFILNLYFAKVNFNLQFGRTHEQRVVAYLASCFGNRRSLPELIVLDLWAFFKTRWNTLAALFVKQDLALLKRRNTFELLIIVFSYLGRGAVSLYIVFKCLANLASYSIGQMTMFIQSFAGGVGALGQVMQVFSTVYEGSCYLQTYQQFKALQKTARARLPAVREVPAVIAQIECRNVGFAYPGSSVPALHAVNLVF